MKPNWTSAETLFSLTCLVVGGLALVFLGSLVAEPKVLFGRALSAITPTLFPSIFLTGLVVLNAIHVVGQLRTNAEPGAGITGWARGGVFFGIMTVYALIMTPVGFIISSALAIAALSWFIGNRSIIQIVLLATLAPILLYLAATRLLAVSLPELDAIQLFIAQVIDSLAPAAEAAQ